MLYFCNWGKQNLRGMKKSNYITRKDHDSRRYVDCTTAKLTKNLRGLNCNDDDKEGKRMSEQPGKCIWALNLPCIFAKNWIWYREKQYLHSCQVDI